MTNGSPAEDGSTKEAFKSMKKMSPDTEEASERYQKSVKFIEETNTIYEARQHVKKFTRQTTTPSEQQSARKSTPNHQSPPPSHRSIKVTTLQNLALPYIRRYLHRLPMLLRLLNPLSYFYPVKISSITAKFQAAG
jgi:hypothetical protein